MARAYRNIWKWLYCISGAGIVFGFVLNGCGYVQMGKDLLVLGVAISLAAFICFEKTVCGACRSEYIAQLTICYSILSLFMLLALTSPYSIKRSYRVIFAEVMGSFLPCSYLLIKYYFNGATVKCVLNYIKERWPLFAICLLFVILSVDTLDDWLRLDSDTYYSYVQDAKQFDFTFSGVSLLKLGGHQSYGAAFLYLLGEYLTPNSPAGARIVQIVCICISTFMLSSLLGILKLDGGSRIINALYCSVFAFAPQILGTIYGVCLDTMLLCFWIWVIYFYAVKRKILFLLSACFLVFSKETGVFILFGFGAGEVLYYLSLIKRHEFRMMEAVHELALPVICAFLFLASWFFGGTRWFSSMNSLALASSSDGFHKIGWSTVSVITKIKQIFFMNFHWILTASIVIFAIYKLFGRITKKRTHSRQDKGSYARIWYPILGSYLLFILFNFSYITYGLPRYVAPGLFVLILIWAFCNVKLKAKLKIILLSVTASLMLVQSFVTVDPVTRALFRNVDMGSRTIVSAIKYSRYDNAVTTDDSILSERVFGHTMEYNRQYSDFGDAFEELLQEIGYQDQTLVLVECIYKPYEFSSVTMFCKEGGNNAVYHYNAKSGQISYDPASDVLNIHFINPEDASWKELLPNYESVYVVSFPYNPSYEEFCAVDGVDYESQLSIVHRGWQIDARKLK